MGPLEIRANKNILKTGDNLEIKCSLPNIRGGQLISNRNFSWVKINGQLLSNVEPKGPVLKIGNLQLPNRGIYRCNLVTRHETIFADYTIDVKG